MASKGQMSGMRGVYLVAAELAKRGFIVSPTSRSAFGADLLVTDQKCKRAYSVQVKTNGRASNFWLIGNKAKETVSNTHIYVLVNVKNTKNSGEMVEYFVAPSKQLSRRGYHRGNFPHIAREKILHYKDKWSLFGRPR
ncbi:MAG: hypothetical protein ACREC3_11170 [Methyloceanibacter sp.]